MRPAGACAGYPRPRRSGARSRGGIPHALLLEAATRGSTIEWRSEVRLANRPHDLLRVTLADGEVLDLALARDVPALRRASYPLALPGAETVEVVWEWPEWRSDPELGWAPTGHRVDVNRVRFQDVRYDRYAADAPAAAALLSLPTAARGGASDHMREPAAGSDLPATGEVAPGVRVLDVNGFMVMFVEFKDFVVAIEAPENHPGLHAIPATRDTTRVTAAFHAAIHSALPAKPIRYVVVSHHHSDHLGGIREFAIAGATVIAAPSHTNAVRAAIADRVLAAAARIETVSGRREITDGERTLEIWNVGRNPHTDENLFVWLPKERIAFQGDLFYYQAGGEFPPSGREHMNRFFTRWLDRHGLKPRAIYGVHNSEPAGPNQLAEMRSRP